MEKWPFVFALEKEAESARRSGFPESKSPNISDFAQFGGSRGRIPLLRVRTVQSTPFSTTPAPFRQYQPPTEGYAVSKKQSGRRLIRRNALLEQMEKRLPLAADAGHNFLLPGDVNNDHLVKATDALAIINFLSKQTQSAQGESVDAESVDASIRSMFYDVNDDGNATAGDAIRVINELAREGESAGAAELLVGETGAHARIELQLKDGGLAELEVRVADAPASQSFDVVVGGEIIGQIQTNDQGRGKLELKFGGNHPELPAVLANADASTPVAIGDFISGTLGSLGEVQSHDGGNDGPSDDSVDDDGVDDDGVDELESSTDDSSSSALSDGNSDDPSDELSDGQGDAASDASTDGGSDDQEGDRERD